MEALKEENTELKEKNVELEDGLEQMGRKYLREAKRVSKLQTENSDLFGRFSKMTWDKVALEQERRIVVRTWRTRGKDRAHYLRITAVKYSGVARK